MSALLGADQQLSSPRLDRAHCFNRVQDQVQDDLLQLNTIPLNGKQSVRKPGLDRDTILGDCASRQYNHLIDRRIEIKTLLSRRRFLDVITDAVDDVSGSIGIAHDAAERFANLRPDPAVACSPADASQAPDLHFAREQRRGSLQAFSTRG